MNLDEQLEKVIKAYQDLAKSAGITAQEITKLSMTKEVVKEKEMEKTLSGSYKGHDVYWVEAKEYFAHKEEADAQDVFWRIERDDKISDLLVHRGTVIATVVGKSVEPVRERKAVSEYFKPLVEVKVEPKKAGNPTPEAKKVVTERHSVEYYMSHTIEVLEDGVKYGEQALKEQAKNGKRKAAAIKR